MGTAEGAARNGDHHRPGVLILASVTGLFTLAITQPLLDLVGRNAAFVVAHDVRGAGLVALTLGIALGVPLVIGGVVLLVAALHRGTGALLHDLIVAVLVAVAVEVVVHLSGLGERLPGAVEVLVAAAAGVAVGVWFHRNATVRWLVGATVLAAPVVVVLFLFATPVRALLSSPTASGRGFVESDEGPPIVLVVFDELPLATLLNEQHEIDASAFPAFARLAADATFFRNATASHSSTVEALPALLSGRYVPVNTLPIASSHPTNLFTVLSGRYQPHAVEPLTQLCIGVRCRGGGLTGRGTSPTVLLRDVGIVGLHLLVPDDWSGVLPPIDAGWRNFGQDSDEEVPRGAGTGVLRENTPAEFRRFVRQIRPEIRPTLHVLHALLPHRPWRYLPDGKRHGGAGEPSLGPDGWTAEPWPVAQSHQLHMAQTQLTDRLLAGLLQRLERRGMYDETLLIVAADHGMSLVPGTPPREVTARTLREIAPVPLFVKLPGQTAGAISDKPVETVDIAPTVLDAVGAQAPPNLDGRSLLDEEGPARTGKRLHDVLGKPWEFDVSLEPLFESVQRKVDLFGAGAGYDLYGLAPDGFAPLLGRRVIPLPPTDTTLTAVIARGGAFRRVDPNGQTLPALVTGQVNGADAGDVIGLALDGRIVALTQLTQDGAFRALLPPDAFRAGVNRLEMVRVSPQGPLTTIPIAPAEDASEVPSG